MTVFSTILLLIKLSLPGSLAGASAPSPLVYSEIEERQKIHVHTDFSFTHQIEKTIRITNPEGRQHANIILPYNSFSKIHDFSLEVEDLQTGKIIEKAKLRDLNDAASFSATSGFDDLRYRSYQIKTGKIPIAVRIVYQKKYDSNFFLPTWIPVHHYNQKVVKSELEIIYPPAVGIRYKALNMEADPDKKLLADGHVQLSWTVSDLPIQDKSFEIADDHRLILAPMHFSVDGFKGNMEDWGGLGRWQYELMKDRNQLPEDFVKKIQSLADQKESTYEKVTVLYDYLQDNFRYVSIQLGIGGWQPMAPEKVIDYSYGDCKGLTNLMKSMLEAVQIPSNYTLVYAGAYARDIEIDLPSNQFNHVILQVPTEQDPIWLECTANDIPAGYLGTFTRDRHVLVTGPDGGYLTKTPSYTEARWNTLSSFNQITLDNSGNATITSRWKFQGVYAAQLAGRITSMNDTDKREYIVSSLSIPGLIVTKSDILNTAKDSIPLSEVSFDGVLQRIAQQTMKRTILRPLMKDIPKEAYQTGRLEQEDIFEFRLPTQLQLETNLDTYDFDEAGISLKFESTQQDTLLTIKRTLSLNLSEDLEEEEKTNKIKSLSIRANPPIHFIKPQSDAN